MLRSGLALLLLFKLVVLLSYFSLARSTNNDQSPRRASFERKGPTELSLATDLDHDGLPDAAELRTFNDRERFRRWFTWVAEMQFYKLSDQWNPDERDCAGLVRFAWREALRSHDRGWYQRMGAEYESVAADVSLRLGAEPLHEKLFRRAPGTYTTIDVAEGRFSEFADGQTLKVQCQFREP